MTHDHSDDHTEPPADIELRVKALETLLVEKGLIDPAALDVLIDTYENKVGPKNGAQVVAKAWTDPAYRTWLLEDAAAAISSLGFAGRQGEHITVVENTPGVPTWSSVRCVHVTPGPFSAYRPHGTSPHPIGPARSPTLAGFSKNLAPNCQTTRRSTSGIPRPKCAT